jgi:hypothetical protein
VYVTCGYRGIMCIVSSFTEQQIGHKKDHLESVHWLMFDLSHPIALLVNVFLKVYILNSLSNRIAIRFHIGT